MLLLITVVNPFGSFVHLTFICVSLRVSLFLRVYVSRLTCIHCSYASSSLFLFNKNNKIRQNSPTLIYFSLERKTPKKIKRKKKFNGTIFCLCSPSSSSSSSSLCIFFLYRYILPLSSFLFNLYVNSNYC